MTAASRTNAAAAGPYDRGPSGPVVTQQRAEARFSGGARWFLIGLLVFATTISLVSLIALDTRSAPWLGFAVLAVACAAAQLVGTRVGRSQSYPIAIPFVMAAVVTLPPGLVVAVVLARHAPDWIRGRDSWQLLSFNAASDVVSALLAWTVVHATDDLNEWANVALFAAVVVFVVCGRLLAATRLRLAYGRSFWDSGLLGAEALTTDLVLGGLGPVVVVLWRSDPVLALVAAAPMLLVHRALAASKLREDRDRERELRAAEMKYRLLVEQLPLATYILDPDHSVRYISPQIESILGFTVREAIEGEEFWTERLHPDDRERVPVAWKASVGKGQAFRGEYRMLDAKGRTVWIQDEAVAARDGDTTLYFQGYLLDITERKETEERLARLSQQNEMLLRSVGEGIFGLDLAGHVTFANAAAGQITGWPAERLRGLNLHCVVAHRHSNGAVCTGLDCPFEATLADGAGRHFEAELTRLSDGRSFAADCMTAPLVENGEVIGAAIVIRDISEQRALEEQLRQAQKLEAVGKLAGGIAHDFNNLLTAISGHSELALAEGNDGSVGQHISEIKRAADRASALTQQLLAFSRKQVLQPRVLKVNEVVSEVESLLRRLIREDIALELRLDPAVAAVRADLSQLEQVLVNLAVNARDAMPRGGRLAIETANARFEGDMARSVGVAPGAYVALSVSDTGHGMDAATCMRVFEPFFTTKEPGKGTGLGLATAYGIVAQSGGTMCVDSAPGEGAVFTVYLPAAADDVAEAPSAPQDTNATAQRSGTVLLVEDEEMVRDLTREMLERAGVAVLTAGNADDALAVCTEHLGPIDVLLTDVVMPGMSGHALAELLRTIRPELEVVYTSGYSDEVVAARGTLEPGTGFLAKPFTGEELMTTITAALARKERATWA